MKMSNEWENLEDEFANQDSFEVDAQILVGADNATIFPHALKDADGSLVQTETCQLMQSSITNRLIMFGSNSENADSTEDRDTSEPPAQAHQVQVDTAAQKDAELASHSDSQPCMRQTKLPVKNSHIF